jgi:hypothetical protein
VPSNTPSTFPSIAPSAAPSRGKGRKITGTHGPIGRKKFKHAPGEKGDGPDVPVGPNDTGSTWATVDSGSHKKKKGAIKLSNNLTIRRKSDDESNDRYDKSNDVQN